MATKTVYLLKGKTLGAKGLPGGKLDAKKKDIQLTEKQLKVVSGSVEYLLAQGILSYTPTPVESKKSSGKNENSKTTGSKTDSEDESKDTNSEDSEET